jgi:hypothetical protein
VSDPNIVTDSYGFIFSLREKFGVILAKPESFASVGEMMLGYAVIRGVIGSVDASKAGNRAKLPKISVVDLVVSCEV